MINQNGYRSIPSQSTHTHTNAKRYYHHTSNPQQNSHQHNHFNPRNDINWVGDAQRESATLTYCHSHEQAAIVLSRVDTAPNRSQ